MKVLKTNLSGVLEIQPHSYGDNRGEFSETYNMRRYDEVLPSINFVQDNKSVSKKGVLRGLHFQKSNPQGKLVFCSSGSVLDVVVDIKRTSKTFGKYFSIELSANNRKQLWIPPGFAHGFLSLEDHTVFQYKCTDYYYPQDESGIIWNCPDIGIDWGITSPIISTKDSSLLNFSEILSMGEI